MDKVAVITATRNRAGTAENPGYLEPCIASVCEQYYENHVHVIIDDGSSDATPELVEFYSSKDSRIVYIRREKSYDERKTASIAQNVGIDAVMNPADYGFEKQLNGVGYVTILHSDDMLPHNSLSKRVETIKKCPRNACTYGQMKFMLEHPDIRAFWLFSPHNGMDLRKLYKKVSRRSLAFPNHSLLWKKDFLSNVGLYDPEIGAGEDLDMSLSTMECALMDDLEIPFIQEPVYYYRLHPDTITHTIEDASMKSDKERIRKKHGLPPNWVYVMRRFLTRPHSFLPEPIKNKLRPIRNRYLRKIYEFEDAFVTHMDDVGYNFWETRQDVSEVNI